MWGPWGLGMAATDGSIASSMQRAGLSLLSPAFGLRLLAAILATATAVQPVAARVSWGRLLQHRASIPTLLADLVPAAHGKQTQTQTPIVFTSPASAETAVQHELNMQQFVAEVVEGMLGRKIEADQVGAAV